MQRHRIANLVAFAVAVANAVAIVAAVAQLLRAYLLVRALRCNCCAGSAANAKAEATAKREPANLFSSLASGKGFGVRVAHCATCTTAMSADNSPVQMRRKSFDCKS